MKNHSAPQSTENTSTHRFDELIELYRPELLLHCYRMLGSLLDAEDMLQETLLKAWKKNHLYTDEGHLRAWLYKIATNTCLDMLRRTKKRALIQADIPMSTEPYPARTPLNGDVWLDPCPDALLPEPSSLDDKQNPEALYTVRESVSLAFMAMLHKLSPRQRAILILCDVLGFKAKEAADILGMSVTAVNANLLRARKAINDPQVTHSRKVAKPDVIQTYLQRYIYAWETKDITKLVPLLKEDVVMSMPPLPTWYGGLLYVESFLSTLPFAGDNAQRWQTRLIGSNGQPGLAVYEYHPDQGDYRFFGIHVLTIETDKIARIEHFMAGNHSFLTTAITPAWVPYFKLPDRL